MILIGQGPSANSSGLSISIRTTAHDWYGEGYLSLVGRHAEAIAEEKRAQELDPVSLFINTGWGRAYYYAHEYDRAID